MFTFRHALTALAVTSTLALVACSSGQDTSTTSQPTTAGATPAVSTSAANPLTADQVNVQMTLQGAPALSADGRFIEVTVNLANHGKTTLTSTGYDPVNLGAHSADANGTIVDYELARATIPDAAPDSQVTATIRLPVDKTVGQSVQILPVQENVAWFDAWGTKPLTVGPFNSCASSAIGKVCAADGKPLASAVR